MKLDTVSESVRRANPHLFGAPDPPTGAGHDLEHAIHNDIFEECRSRGWIPLHGSMAERTHRTEGEPDFTILADRGRTFFIECKSKAGKLSPKQHAMAAHAAKLSHIIHIVRTLEEFRAIVDR